MTIESPLYHPSLVTNERQLMPLPYMGCETFDEVVAKTDELLSYAELPDLPDVPDKEALCRPMPVTEEYLRVTYPPEVQKIIGPIALQTWVWSMHFDDPPLGFKVIAACGTAHCVNIRHLRAVDEELDFSHDPPVKERYEMVREYWRGAAVSELEAKYGLHPATIRLKLRQAPERWYRPLWNEFKRARASWKAEEAARKREGRPATREEAAYAKRLAVLERRFMNAYSELRLFEDHDVDPL